MKKLALLMLIFIIFIPSAAAAEETDEELMREQAREAIEEEIDSAMENLDFTALQEFYDPELFGGSLEEAVREVSREGLELTPKEVFTVIAGRLTEVLKSKAAPVTGLVIMLVAMSLLKNMETGFGEEGASGAAFYAGQGVVCMVVMTVLYGTVECARGAIGQLSGGVEALTPLLTAILTGMGGASGTNVMSPVMSALTGTVFMVIERVVFPVITVMAVLSMISSFSREVDLSGFSRLGEKGVKWLLGLIFVVFIGLLAIKGIGGAAMEGIYYKTAKYTVEKMVPVVGGMFSDTMDTLIACGVIVQNSVGTVGLVALGAKLITPVLSIAADILLLRCAGAVALPLSHKKSAALLEEGAKLCGLMNVTLLVCSAMAFISIALLMGSAGISFAMR